MEDTTTVEPPASRRQLDRLVSPFYERDGITIYCADCKQVLPFLDCFDLVLTDPPYGINATKMTMGKGQSDKAKEKRFNASAWDTAVPRNMWQVIDAGRYACIWGGNYMTNILEPTNDWLIWHKANDGRSFSECEMAWTNFGCQSRHLTHHWGGEVKRHPTQKPLDVIRWCFRFVPDAPQTVIDPFMGTGTTLVAARLNGMQAVGIEVSEEYCSIAVDRLRQNVLCFGSEG